MIDLKNDSKKEIENTVLRTVPEECRLELLNLINSQKKETLATKKFLKNKKTSFN